MCSGCTTAATFDQQQADGFAQRMIGVLNSAALALMTSIGHRTGLFDQMRGQPGRTSAEIAKAAKLNERYVREWLGAMVTGGIVNYDAQARTYRLPDEHAAFLTRAASPNNIANSMQFISVLGGVETRIVDCFQRGGGLPYEAYERFHDVMADESDQTTISGLVEKIIPLVPDLPARLAAGIDVLDVGCGRGRAMRTLAQRYPHSRFFGFDMSPDAIATGQKEAAPLGLKNLTLKVQDVAALPESQKFDLITAFDAIHDQRDPATVLSGIRRALKPGGVFLMQDIAGSSHVDKNVGGLLAPFVYTVSCMHCMSVSLGQGGAGLGAAWGEELAEQMLREAGFKDISRQRLEHDIMNTYFVAKP